MKKRTIGKLLLELEELLDEAIDVHELQTGDILSLIFSHLQVHRPDAFEEYTDGTGRPEMYYGVKRGK